MLMHLQVQVYLITFLQLTRIAYLLDLLLPLTFLLLYLFLPLGLLILSLTTLSFDQANQSWHSAKYPHISASSPISPSPHYSLKITHSLITTSAICQPVSLSISTTLTIFQTKMIVYPRVVSIFAILHLKLPRC